MKEKALTFQIARAIVLAAIVLSTCLPALASTDKKLKPAREPLLNTGIESPFVKVVKAVRDSVVYISGVYEVNPKSSRYFKNENYHASGSGSGFIFKKQGKKIYILTNNHVVADARTIEVTLSDKSRYRAKVAGGDAKSDLAVIWIETDHPVKITTLGDSDKIEIGAWALAIGNPFSTTTRKDRRNLINMHDRSVTVGVVSGKGRSHLDFGPKNETPVFQDYIQTDAAINPGNSGGPLFDIHGRVIGVNAAILSSVNIGIGYAIPINLSKKIAQDLIKHGRVIRAYLGLVPQALDENLVSALALKSKGGVLVARVTDDTPAGKAGLKKGDVIIKFARQNINELNKFRMLVARTPIGETVDIVVLRKGKEKKLSAKLEEYPAKDLVTPVSIAVSSHWLGIRVKKKGSEELMVVGIEEYSPAYQSKLQRGDIILEVNHTPVKDWKDFKEISKALEAKKHITLYVKRGKENLFVGISNY